ncbi:MAG: aminotransferase class V-fold PLP-dependent enzyme [Solirubrobacteraceae bacterium]
MTDAAAFRAQFPVLEHKSYLNAGTEGPVPRAAIDAVKAELDFELEHGRCGKPYFEALMDLATRARAGYAAVLGAAPENVALTGSTTDGVNTVIGGLDLKPGDEILTSDEEHPGLLAPLARVHALRGARIRAVPFAELAGEVKSSTRLVACSHVSWATGRVVDMAALRASGAPVLLDAAQGIGAVPVDVQALGCDYYAASGQKWMCGPEGSGCLYVKPEALESLTMPWPGYGSLADPHEPLTSPPAEGAARFDHGFPPAIRSVWVLASIEVLAQAGWDWVHDRAATLAARLADDLAARGIEVAPRGRSTLVSWSVNDAEAEVERLAGHGFVVRSIPAFNSLRASVGAWSSEDELDRLASLATG